MDVGFGLTKDAKARRIWGRRRDNLGARRLTRRPTIHIHKPKSEPEELTFRTWSYDGRGHKMGVYDS